MNAMQTILQEIDDIDDVRGCLFITMDGDVAYSKFSNATTDIAKGFKANGLVDSLADYDEADVLFENYRLYLRNVGNGYLFILVEPFAVLSLIKLQCDVLIPKLRAHKPKGLKRFFKR